MKPLVIVVPKGVEPRHMSGIGKESGRAYDFWSMKLGMTGASGFVSEVEAVLEDGEIPAPGFYLLAAGAVTEDRRGTRVSFGSLVPLAAGLAALSKLQSAGTINGYLDDDEAGAAAGPAPGLRAVAAAAGKG